MIKAVPRVASSSRAWAQRRLLAKSRSNSIVQGSEEEGVTFLRSTPRISPDANGRGSLLTSGTLTPRVELARQKSQRRSTKAASRSMLFQTCSASRKTLMTPSRPPKCCRDSCAVTILLIFSWTGMPEVSALMSFVHQWALLPTACIA